MSLITRAIDVTIALGPQSNPGGTDNFGAGTGNTVTLSGLRVSTHVDILGGPGFSTADVRIFGMTKDQMNKLTILGKPLNFFKDNGIAISAGDAASGMSLIFQGAFYAAYQDFLAAPDVSFYISAQVGALGAMKPVPPASYQGSAAAGSIFSSLATQMGLKFENSGVSVQLTNPYFPGTARDQAMAAAVAANVNILIDGDPPDGTLAIWPRTGSRGGQVPEIGPTTGLVGYPQYTDGGISIKTLFNPNLVMGGKFNLATAITPAAGQWVIRRLSHELESQEPGGSWFTMADAYRAASNVIQ